MLFSVGRIGYLRQAMRTARGDSDLIEASEEALWAIRSLQDLAVDAMKGLCGSF
jgi:hypothetical protein